MKDFTRDAAAKAKKKRQRSVLLWTLDSSGEADKQDKYIYTRVG